MALSAGIVIGNQFTCPHSVNVALAQAHEYLYKEVCGNGGLTQTDLTELSGCALQIAYMRLRFLKADDVEWRGKYDAAMGKPSVFQNGSLEPYDLNMRAYELVTTRIKELRNKIK